jgi:cubilin
MRASSGTFSSPNWPKTYNNNEVCDWLIVLPDCTKKIKITFQGFSVAGKMPSCVKDQVYVRAGVELTEESVGRYCSLSIPKPITIDSHTARVTMMSGPQHGKIRFGFTATYQAIDA